MSLEPFRLERYFAKYEFKAKYLASCSDSESVSLSDLLAREPGAREALDQIWLGYGESQGSPELRKKIAQTYARMKPEQVLTHTGAGEAIFNFFHACFEPGDHVVIHFPAYQSLYSVPRSLGIHVSHWEARFENQWRLDLEDLKKQIRPNTKAVIVNVPHNPTGYLMTAEEQKELISILREKGIYLFSDEVYRDLDLPPFARLPAACDLYENAVSLGVLSKSYGLAGLRLGWVATPNARLLEKMAAQKGYTTICNSVVSEKLASIALEHGEALISRNREIVVSNRSHFQKFVERWPDWIEVVPPRGGTMVFPRGKSRFDVSRFVESILEKRSVMILGGECFDMPTRYFRIGLGRKSFPEVLDQIEQHLKTF